MTTNLKPSILVSNIFDPISKDESNIIQLYKEIANLNFYKSIETRVLFDEDVRNEFSKLTKENQWDVTFWVTGNLNSNNLSLSDLDENRRIEAIEYVKQLIQYSNQSSGKYVGIPSGKRVNQHDLEYQAFLSSTVELLRYMEDYPSLELILEPLDQNADKKHVIGNLEKCKKLLIDLEDFDLNKNLLICLDTAHIALNNDDIYKTIDALSIYSDRVHFANAVLNESHTLYGDKHIPYGKPGFLDEGMIKEISTYLKKSTFHSEDIYITMEIRSSNVDEMWILEEKTRNLIEYIID